MCFGVTNMKTAHALAPPPQASRSPSGHHQGHQAHAVLCSQEEIPGETMPSAVDPEKTTVVVCPHP